MRARSYLACAIFACACETNNTTDLFGNDAGTGNDRIDGSIAEASAPDSQATSDSATNDSPASDAVSSDAKPNSDATATDANGEGGACLPIGSACTSFEQCCEASGAIGLCQTSYPGGYCTQLCNLSSPCPSGSTCDGSGAQSGGCYKNCQTPGVTSECRSGYVCDFYWVDNTGSQGSCVAACDSADDCNPEGGSDLSCENGRCCGKSRNACCTTGAACSGDNDNGDGPSVCGSNGYCT